MSTETKPLPTTKQESGVISLKERGNLFEIATRQRPRLIKRLKFRASRVKRAESPIQIV